MRIDEIGTEQHLGHPHRVGGVAGRLGRALAGEVAVPEVGVLHIEMALAGRDVHRLAGAAAREVDGGRHVRELDEVDEVGERRVAPAAFEVGDEGRAADGREHRGVAAEAHGARGVACMDLEGRGRGREQRAAEAAREAHAFALHIGAGGAP